MKKIKAFTKKASRSNSTNSLINKPATELHISTILARGKNSFQLQYLRPVTLSSLGEIELLIMSGGNKVRLLELHGLEEAKQVRLLLPLHERLLQFHIALRQQNTNHSTGESFIKYILLVFERVDKVEHLPSFK